VAFCS